MKGPDAVDAHRFRNWIAGQLGLRFEDSQLGFLTGVLAQRATSRALPYPSYVEELERSASDHELQTLIGELTVPETYFFRHAEQYRAYAAVALPAARRVRGPDQRPKVLSVGCASGEEPYSLVMWARDHGGWQVEVFALDINPAMLAKAARGLYSPWALRETPAEVQQRWFRAVRHGFQLEPEILEAVHFGRMNLAQDHAEFWIPHRFDVIFCRNVLMYFTPDIARAAVARMTRALAPHGYLFLGHAETMRELSDDYLLCHSHDAFYYRRKPSAGDPGHIPLEPFPAPTAILVADAAPQSPDWPAAIRHSAERIHALSESHGHSDGPRAPVAGEKPRPSAVQMQSALELLRKERFGEALALLDGLPPDCALDTEALLLRAALLLQGGRLADAEQVSEQLLKLAPSNAGAHYLLALCRENAGDLPGAHAHDAAAIAADAAFAMPRLHLGLMARRGGDGHGARTLLTEAMSLLEREDAARMLLFGGGFGRDGLMALCRAELQAAGTRA